jgi:hypothetical protein
MNHPHASHTGMMSIPKRCGNLYHPEYYSLECPMCNSQAFEGYQMEQKRLTEIRASINEYFKMPHIGSLTLDYILSQCLSLIAVKEHLSNYDEGSVEYYMQRAKIVRMIQGQIEAYIDNKLEPQ